MERIVVLSDLHLGEEGCSLKDPKLASGFIGEIGSLGKISQFILLGDVFDLSMASFSEAISMGKGFFEELSSLNISEIVYVPGNHDHHLLVLEAEYRDIIQRIINGDTPQKPNYLREFRNSFISGILPPGLKGKLIVKYPNHKIELMGKTYLFHHGHYLSREGSLLAKTSEAIKEEMSLNEFELQNSPIHELIQYSLEQSPIMQKKIEEAWKGGGALAAILVVVDEMMDGEGIAGRAIRWFLNNIAKKGKKHSMRGASIDDKMIERIKNYLKLSNEFCHGFVFGHTHIPEGRISNGFIIANAGSWLDEGKTSPNSYIVIEDKLIIKKLEGGIIWQE